MIKNLIHCDLWFYSPSKIVAVVVIVAEGVGRGGIGVVVVILVVLVPVTGGRVGKGVCVVASGV